MARKQLSYDGFGINGPDKYRSRIATFRLAEHGPKYGPLFEKAPEMLKLLKMTKRWISGADTRHSTLWIADAIDDLLKGL